MTTAAKPSITVIILTYNEEIHMERCLRSAAALAQRVVVVDSFSTDGTVDLARMLGAEVVQRKFKHQADQFQWALDNCNVTTDWLLRLDADEYIEDALIAEVSERVSTLPADVTGVNFKRKFVFMGRWIRWGGYYPTVLTRMWRTGVGQIEQRWMDEHVVLSRGSSLLFGRGDIVDENLHGIGAWVDKHNRYATRQMVDFLNREYGFYPIDTRIEEGTNAQAKLKRFLRNVMFGKAPVYLRSVLYFLVRYFVRLGFLDGKAGLVFHTMHGLWYFLLIDAKVVEGRAFIRQHGAPAFKSWLLKNHGIDVSSSIASGAPHERG